MEPFDEASSVATDSLSHQSTGMPHQLSNVSVTKTLTRLLAIPTNRSCADCKAALIDASQVHASYSPNLAATTQIQPTEASAARPAPFNHFRRNHAAFAPPTEARSNPQALHVPPLFDLPVDPAIAAASQRIVGHGVFVCSLCGAAHKQLSATTAITKAVMDVTSWTSDDVQWLSTAGGNARATVVLEAHVPLGLNRPTAASTIAERLTFIRAKYEALAFVLPPSGPLASRAWQNIVHHHPEWVGLWGVNDLRSLSGLELREALTSDGTSLNADLLNGANRKAAAELPNRLVDYFCVVTASDCLQPSAILQDLSKTVGPEDFLLAPHVSDCFPTEGMGDFPDHISTFVFPDGCRPSSSALPPSYFSIGLTNAAGERLYGGVLRLYDDNRETLETITAILTNSDYPKSRWPPWLIPASNYSRSHSLSSKHTSTSSDTVARSTVKQSSSAERLTPLVGTASDVMFLPKCLVILSHYPFFELWRKFLLQLYRIALTEAPLPIERFVANFVCEVPLPPPGKVQVKFGFTAKDTWTIERPPENHLPLVNFSYLPLFTCLSVSNVLVVMGCLLQETRVVILTKHYPLLSPVCEALLSLLFPLYWQGMYLPILPYSMLEILDAPVPYLVGLHSRYLTDIALERRPQGVVLVDLDRDEVHLGYRDDEMSPRDVPSLPERHAAKLKTRLVESASCVYVVPNNHRSGFVSCGLGTEVPAVERDMYAQTSGIDGSNHSSYRRRDVLPHTDKAYNDNELLVPLSGFLSEHGYMSQREASTGSASKEKKGLFQFARPLRKSSSFDSATPENCMYNLLDLIEPPGFSSSEIREAFLRFFTSLFQTYRAFINGKEFRSSEFTASLNLANSNSIAFVKAVVESQMFQGFIDEATEEQKSHTVLFFDASINAKINRSKKVVLTGRKKETSFLKDNRSVVTEVFTPPPPSNFGLPDDGRLYHYGTFPELNPLLFGKIRRPMQWEQHKSPSLKRVNRRGSAQARANEQAVVAKAARSTMNRATKRGGRNLETALRALSTPFVPTPTRPQPNADGRDLRSLSRERSFRSTFSDLTLPSTLNMTPEMVSSAEEIVLNARRKQAILLGIIVKLQGCCRMHLVRRRLQQAAHSNSCPSKQKTGQLRVRISAIRIQCWIRLCLARTQYVRIREAIIVIQAYRRGFIVRTAYRMLLAAVESVQALYRGFAIRQLLATILASRLQTYKRVIFSLWGNASTPLSYRAKFWPLLKSPRPIFLRMAEQELKRLWAELNIDFHVHSANGEHLDDFDFWIGQQFGLSNSVFWKARQADETSSVVTATNRRGRKSGNSHDPAADRVLAERTQIYERLSLWPVDSVDSISSFFNRFSIPLKEKKKKVALAGAMWTKFEHAGHSAELMMEMFPELQESTDIVFVHPSKKALRRFSPSDPMPKPLHASMRAHRILDDRIRSNVAEIADIALRIVPSYLCERPERVKSRSHAASPRLLSSLMKSHGVSNPATARELFIRQTLFKEARREHVNTNILRPAKVAASVDKRVNTKGKPNRGTNHGKVERAPSYPDLLAATLPQTHDANETFWVRQ